MPQQRLSRREFPGHLLFTMALLAAFLLWSSPDIALAGIGGQFAKSKVGLYLLLPLIIILAPFGIWVAVSEARAKSRARKALDELAELHSFFYWPLIEGRVKDAVRMLHEVWTKGDLSRAMDFMVPRYYFSQQALLDGWKQDGRCNHLELDSIVSLRPLNVRTGDEFTNPSVWVEVEKE